MFTGLFLNKNKAPFTFKQRNGLINTILSSVILLIPAVMIIISAPQQLLADGQYQFLMERGGFLDVLEHNSHVYWVMGGVSICTVLSVLFVIAIIRSVSLLSIKN
jgi:hypothetical protein